MRSTLIDDAIANFGFDHSHLLATCLSQAN